MAGHSCWRMALIIITFLVFAGAMAINALSSLVEYYDSGLFLSSTGNLSDKYPLEITPAGWTFSIWGAIYIWQLFLMIYLLTTLCGKSNGGYLYYSPPYISPLLYVLYILNLGCNVTWLFVWDREYLEMSFGFLAGCAFTLYLGIGITMYTLHKHAPQLISQCKRQHITYVIAFVLNGLGLYAAWVSIATLLNMSIMLTYVLEFDQHIASSIALGALALDVVVYACLDLVLFERHFRYVYTPWIVLHVALAGSVYKNWDDTNANSIFTAALLCCGGFLFLVKIIMSIVRSRSDPLYVSSPSGKGNVDA